MKLPFTIYDLRFTRGTSPRPSPHCSCVATRRGSAFESHLGGGHPVPNRQSRSGVALVITLIMLSVTLVMALAFLAVSRRERNAVSTTTDTTTARLAAESALAAAQAQIAANIMASTNVAAYSYGLIVSTNYINGLGFVQGSGNPTNVNYDYEYDGARTPLTAAERLQNIANLQFLPRAPVYVVTNQQTGSNEFRFYLDLNRNGRDEANNNITNYDNLGNVILAGGNTPLITSQPGDPEWIGVLEHPDQPHGPNNHFIARYAFVAVPIGNALDLNAIHNEVLDQSLSVQDGFFRNQGVGTWELNLAAFLADLNTNQWLPSVPPNNSYYAYNWPGNNSASIGRAFDDARSILSWRYNNNYNLLLPAEKLFTNNAYAFTVDGIDDYSDGPLQTTVNANADFVPDVPSRPWAGADNTNQFFSLPSDVFGSTMNLGNFPARLTATGNGVSTYDRYTFYRMLDQLGTGSEPESDKLNLNYANAVVTYNNQGVPTGVTVIPGAETNQVSWTATNFFNAAADRMLKLYSTNWFTAGPSNYLQTFYGYYGYNYYHRDSAGNIITNDPTGFGLTNVPFNGMTNQLPAFGITHIPVYVDKKFVYTPAVNRALQLAANIYDATTNSFYPSVFRPIFERDIDHNIYIVGYTSLYGKGGLNTVLGPKDPQLAPPYDASVLSTSPLFSSTPTNMPIRDASGLVNVYGVPWIIGAKKNLPGFNQLAMVNSAQFTRKLQVVRNSVGGPIWTNQMVVMSISNNLGVSFWNSYTNDYPTNSGGVLNMSVVVNSEVDLVVTNSDWPAPSAIMPFTRSYSLPVTRWPGSKWGANGGGTPAANSFFAWQWTNTVVPEAVYNFTTKTFNTTANATYFWDTNRMILDPLPQFGLLATNRLQAFILDGNHVIDYVQLRGPIDNANLNSGLRDPNFKDQTGINYLWSTNNDDGGLSWGIRNQLDISSQPIKPPLSAQWKDPGVNVPGLAKGSIAASQVFFAAILQPSSIYSYTVNGQPYTYTNYELAVQAPYSATRTVYVPFLYQVNDPLVHYTVNDLDAGAAGVWAGNNVHANGLLNHIDYAGTAPFPTPPANDMISNHSRYQPWGKVANNAFSGSAYNFGNAYNLIYKDPLVWSSDYWDFPTNKYPTVGWIGRVHRGTPWQTVYLKAHNVMHALGGGVAPNLASGTNTWAAWTGDYNMFDAANSGPLQDRLLFDLFTTAPNENATRGQLSVNQTHLAAWSALFSGMVALTNAANMPPFASPVIPPTSNSWNVVQPAGVNGLNSALGKIVTGINNQRANFTNADGVVGTFEHKGDILSALALTEQSPFLNWNNGNQQNYGISDEVYEWLPQQMMSLLTCPTSPRYLLYVYGQALKPAPDAEVTSSSTLAGGLNPFGMVTNYQVVAESAARAVIRLERHASPAGTNYSTKVESYNVLPPN